MRGARGCARWVDNSGFFGVVAPQVVPIRNVRVRATDIAPQKIDALHASIIEEVNRDGQRWISAATVNGQSVIRTMVISYLPKERHIKDLQASLVAAYCRLRLEAEASTAAGLEPTAGR